LKNIVFLAGTGIVKMVSEIIEITGMSSEYRLAGIIDDSHEKGTILYDLEVLGPFGDIGEILSLHSITDAVVCIPENYMDVRKRYFRACKELGLTMPSALHPDAVISKDASFGEGVVVMAGTVINPCVRVGNNVIIFSNATIEHDCIVEDNVYISPGVQLGGHVTIQNNAMLGIGSIVLPKRVVGKDSIVGAGAVVTSDVNSGKVVAGVPAREKSK
jgi:UDP-perosamine 4-acetyltransferase